MNAFAQPEGNTLRLYVVNRRDPKAHSFLERVAMLYRLYTYGDPGSGHLVRAEIERAALALTAVFVFDLAAWTLVWNAVFHRGELTVDRMTWLAVAFASLFAVIVISFEQGVVTADWTKSDLRATAKRWITLLLRLAVVVASAIATSQAIEVMVFSNDIADRVHQERVWEEIVSRTLEFLRLDEASKGKGEAAGISQGVNEAMRRKDDAISAVGTTAGKITTLETEVASNKDTLPSLRRELNQQQGIARAAKSRLDAFLQRAGSAASPELASLNAEYSAAARAVRRAQGALDSAKQRISEDESKIGELVGVQMGQDALAKSKGQEYDGIVNLWQSYQSDLVKRRNALQHWIAKVANSSVDDRQMQENDYSYRERPYSFAEQLRVLDDLRFARPAQRRNIIAINPAVLNNLLQLDDPRTLDRNSLPDRLSRAAVVQRMYVGLFILSIFVPSMGVLFKLTMHPQLRNYYSAAHQAAHGNLDAMHYLDPPPPPPAPAETGPAETTPSGEKWSTAHGEE